MADLAAARCAEVVWETPAVTVRSCVIVVAPSVTTYVFYTDSTNVYYTDSTPVEYAT